MHKAQAPKDGKTKKSGPTGHEVMKRKPPDDLSLQPARFEADPKKAYSAEQLAEMGAISVKWNQIESQIDFICSHILFTKTPFWLRIAVGRVLSTAKMTELLMECLERAEHFDDATKQAIKVTFDDFRTYRGYRNAIVHHYIYDHNQGIGTYIDESSKPFQIMVSLEALQNLYNLICAVQQELYKVDLLYRIETDAQRPFTQNKRTGKHEPIPIERLCDEFIPALREELLSLQRQRKALPSLPKFPDAELIRAAEGQARRLDPGEADQ